MFKVLSLQDFRDAEPKSRVTGRRRLSGKQCYQTEGLMSASTSGGAIMHEGPGRGTEEQARQRPRSLEVGAGAGQQPNGQPLPRYQAKLS